jgi:signal peptidase II
VLVGVLVTGLAADLISKQVAFDRIASSPFVVSRAEVLDAPDLRRLIPDHEPVVVVPGLLELTLVLNPGAVFGIGAGKRWLFVAFTAVALVMGLMMFLRWTRAGDWLAHSSLGLLLAGGLGNLYDRLSFACVRDFIHPLPGVHLGGWEVWPYVSNVADALLIVGIIGLMWHLWRADPRRATQRPASD